MDHAHQPGGPGVTFSVIALALICVLALLYLAAVYTQNRRGFRWNGWRIAFFIMGMSVLGLAVSPHLAEWAHHDFRGHMVQHLLIGMIAPLGLVLSAPVTLALRTCPVPVSKKITFLLRSRPVHFFSHPVTAMMLNMGGMYALYMTPLYVLSHDYAALHYLIHVHFFLAGYLFCWAILAGPDPASRPTGIRFRLGVLFVSIAAHATLGKLMYGYLLPQNSPHSAEEIQAAAQLMYYGGDFAEVLLLIALFSMWYKRREKTEIQPDLHKLF